MLTNCLGYNDLPPPPQHMSYLLWKYYYNEELDNFRQLLSNCYFKTPLSTKAQNERVTSYGSPSECSISPRSVTKHRRFYSHAIPTGVKEQNIVISQAEINCRDHCGLTIFHRAVSSTSSIKISFALALLDHPALDLYIQDTENGWTALHRALYFGNASLARAIVQKDLQALNRKIGSKSKRMVSKLVNIKDYEGNSPFDLYNATIMRKPIQGLESEHEVSGADNVLSEDKPTLIDFISHTKTSPSVDGDEVLAWGSSRNYGLGFKDQDDRHHPEKILLRRPDELLYRFYRDYLKSVDNEKSQQEKGSFPKSISDLPILISHRPILIKDAVLSKLHSAILTTDPESNLYMCGFGPGGRLGTGDEDTRFSYVPINGGLLAGKHVSRIALGQNHSIAIIADGSVLSWGSNMYGQLGYNLPRQTVNDQETFCIYPRQIFGPLKRESITGIAASALHSVAHTSTSLFTWGKNEGQLGLMDSDSRTLEVLSIPRKVAMSVLNGPISSVSAIDSATIVLLSNHTVCIFSNYGYNIVKFPLSEKLSNNPLKMRSFITGHDPKSNHITSIVAGGDTVGAVSSRGDLFILAVRNMPSSSATSTTNPTKIKESLSRPERVWKARKGSYDGVKSVGISENGSVIFCTRAGAVWHGIKRVTAKNPSKSAKVLTIKNFEFQRIPGLANIAAVRSTTFGVFAAIQKNSDSLRKNISVNKQNIWVDIAPLMIFSDLEVPKSVRECKIDGVSEESIAILAESFIFPLKRAVLFSHDLEACVARHLLGQKIDRTLNIQIRTSHSEVKIPVHGFVLGRSPVLREALRRYRKSGNATIPGVLRIENDSSETLEDSHINATMVFEGLDFITILNIVLYLYTDTLVDVWQFTRYFPAMKFRYRQVRAELMKTASHLKLEKLEAAVRLMIEPEKRMDVEIDSAIRDLAFFEDADTIIGLKCSEMKAHSSILCRRCPFFEGLFNGRAAGRWLSSRCQGTKEPVRVDLKHIEPGVFNLVLRHIYADIGTEIFYDVSCANIDEFSDLVLDVMAIANELILNRLSQVCQEIIGRFRKF